MIHSHDLILKRNLREYTEKIKLPPTPCSRPPVPPPRSKHTGHFGSLFPEMFCPWTSKYPAAFLLCRFFCTLFFSFNNIPWRSLHIGTWRAALIFLTAVYYSIIVGHLRHFWSLAITKNFAVNNLEHMSFYIVTHPLIHSFIIHSIDIY